MKMCFKCGKEKPLFDFYEHKRMADGYLNKCKECTKSDVSNNYRKNIGYCKEYEKNRAQLPHRIAARNAYASSPRGREVGNRLSRKWAVENPEKRKESLLKWEANNPEKRAAHNAVFLAIQRGVIEKSPCELCGESSAQAHHDDYAKPLNVRWLCSRCHARHHVTVRRCGSVTA